MNKYIVTTTINPPTLATIKYSRKEDWTLIVVGDTKTPHYEYENLNCIYLSPEYQEKTYPELSETIGWKSIQRRNIGFVEAYNRGADIVATVDDDNIPYDDWGTNVDILASLALALTMLFCIRILEKESADAKVGVRIANGIALGGLLAFVGMTKHQFFWMGPAVLGLFLAKPIWEICKTRKWAASATPRIWLTGAGAVAFVIVIDLCHRIFGGPEIGFLAHVALLRDMYYWAQGAWERSSPFVYVNYLRNFGGIFWAVCFTGAGFAFLQRKQIAKMLAAFPAWRQESLFLLLAVTVVFAAITQKFSYREARYLFPLLPALLAVAVAGIVALLSKPHLVLLRSTVGALMVVAILGQVRQARTTVDTMIGRMDPVDRLERTQFWKYLGEASGPACERIRACRFFTYTYDYEWPQYRYNVGKAATVTACDLPTHNALMLRHQLNPRLEESTCYVLPTAYQNEGVPAPVTVQKTLGVRLNVEQALKLVRRGTTGPGEKVSCEPQGDAFDCYLSRRFFQRLQGSTRG